MYNVVSALKSEKHILHSIRIESRAPDGKLGCRNRERPQVAQKRREISVGGFPLGQLFSVISMEFF